MFAFKFSFVIIFLVTISIIHYTFAIAPIDACCNVLKREKNFTDAGGLQNFKNAFKNLSIRTIDSKYSPPKKETPYGKSRRELTHVLVNAYFANLFKNNGLVLKKAKNPVIWCSNELFGPHETIDEQDLNAMHEALVDSQMAQCLDSIVKLLDEANDVFYKHVVFDKLYHNWDLDLIEKLQNEYDDQEDEDKNDDQEDEDQGGDEEGGTYNAGESSQTTEPNMEYGWDSNITYAWDTTNTNAEDPTEIYLELTGLEEPSEVPEEVSVEEMDENAFAAWFASLSDLDQMYFLMTGKTKIEGPEVELPDDIRFAKKYFYYFVEYVEKLDKGRFNSIRVFCRKEGQFFIPPPPQN